MPARDRAWANVVGVAHGVVQGDGSDVEGSPGYAMYIEKLLTDVERAAATCGLQSDNIKALRGSLYNFVAQAVRPDFKLESLGDTINQSLRGSFGIGDGTAEWIRSAGTAGTSVRPDLLDVRRRLRVRTRRLAPAAGRTRHLLLAALLVEPAEHAAYARRRCCAHALLASGVAWIGDPGPYRYDNRQSLRWFMKSRPAHSSVTVSARCRARAATACARSRRARTGSYGRQRHDLPRTTAPGEASASRAARRTCAPIDAMIVVDYANAKKIKGKKERKKIGKRLITERWQIPPGIGAQNVNDVITLSSGDKRLDIIKSGPGSWGVRTARSGSSVGWFTGKWGQKLPGAVLSRAVPLKPKGDRQALVTVFVPRVDGENVPVVVDANGVTITRGATTVTTALPVPF